MLYTASQVNMRTKKERRTMKKFAALLLALMLLCTCACAEETAPERIVASYSYVLHEDGAYVENLIFNADVVITGENSQIVFSNCLFNGSIILAAEEGTRVMLLGCEVNGQCVFDNQVREADMAYSFPKFMTDTPVNAVCEGCAGSVIALGDFEVSFNGQPYTMADSEWFSDVTNPEAGMAAYEGQEASYFCVGQWWENDQQVLLLLCEYDPGM